MKFAFFPAVDLRDGKCVQLVGVPGTELVALDNPLTQAEHWIGEGADHLHIIDLDGAIQGKRVNAPILAQIVKELDVFIQVGRHPLGRGRQRAPQPGRGPGDTGHCGP